MLSVPVNHTTPDSQTLRHWLATSSRSRDVLLIFLIVLAALYFRRPDAFYNAQLWNEDGTEFLWGYETLGVKCLFFVHNAYFILTNLVAILFGLLSVNLLYIPLCYNLSSFVITFLIAVRLWESARYLNLRYKIAYATCFLFVPIGPDMFMNLANIHFITCFYLIDFLFVGYKHGNKYLNVFFLLLLSFTGPFALVLSPIVVLIIFIDRKNLSAYNILCYAIMLVAGVVSWFTTTGEDIRHRARVQVNPSFALPPEHWHLLKFITNNMEEIFFMHSKIFNTLPQPLLQVVGIILFVGILVFSVISYRKITNPKKFVLPLTALLYITTYIIAFWPQESKLTAFIVSRYYIVPYTCLLWIIILAWDKLIKWWYLAIYMLFFLKHKGNLSSILYDKHWKQEVEEYYQGKRVLFDINDGGANWGWQFELPKRK